MYVPRHFEESRTPVLHAAMRELSVATLVSDGPNGFLVSHLPLLLVPEPAPWGSLVGHLARPNPHWQDGAGRPVVAIFFGPHGYITPNWYPTKRRTGKVVPTWNYIAVHAHGTLRTFDDPARLRAVVTALTELHEDGVARPWQLQDAPESFIEGQLKAIVGLEFLIERLEGKWKLSQNRPGEDIDGVIAGLHERGDDESVALARAVEAARPPR